MDFTPTSMRSDDGLITLGGVITTSILAKLTVKYVKANIIRPYNIAYQSLQLEIENLKSRYSNNVF